MAFSDEFESVEPQRADIDALQEPTVLEFGTGWCGHCQAARPLIAEAFENFSEVAHVRVEDGPGRPLGRSFRVKLWPTLIFLQQGREVQRLVRPTDTGVIRDALAALTTATPE